MDIWALVEAARLAAAGDHRARAILAPASPGGSADMAFFETAARNRGLNVRVFGEREGARLALSRPGTGWPPQAAASSPFSSLKRGADRDQRETQLLIGLADAAQLGIVRLGWRRLSCGPSSPISFSSFSSRTGRADRHEKATIVSPVSSPRDWASRAPRPPASSRFHRTSWVSSWCPPFGECCPHVPGTAARRRRATSVRRRLFRQVEQHALSARASAVTRTQGPGAAAPRRPS